MLIAAIAILVTAVCSIGLFYSILVQQIYDDLKANAHVISRLDFEDASQEVCDQLSEDGLRITLIASEGTVLYDSMEDETKMENHRGRPEVERALAVGEWPRDAQIDDFRGAHILLCDAPLRRKCS